MRFLSLAAAAVFLSASAAHACINDTHTESAETEFRSSYQKMVENVVPVGQSFPWGIVALAAGLSLIVGGTFTIVHFSRK